jgi:hypothetical protein
LCEQYATRAGERATRWFARATTVTFLDRPDHTASDGAADLQDASR